MDEGDRVSERRVLVLGADGFIGKRTVAALAASGWARPVAVGRRPAAPIPGVERLTFDATDPAALAAAMRTADGVVSCIAGDAQTIVGGARALFEPGKSAPGSTIVYLSSMAVYGSAVGLVPETAPLDGVGAYSVAKVDAERMASGRPDVVVLRPGIVYGPGSVQWSGRIAEWLKARRIGDLGAAGDGWCNLVHVDDVAQAIVLSLQRPTAQGQAFNLSMVDPPTWNDYFLLYAKALGAVPLQRITHRRLRFETRVAAIPLKLAEIAKTRLGLGGVRLPQPIPPSLLGLWRQEIRLSMDKTIRELGVATRPLVDGLRETAAYYGH